MGQALAHRLALDGVEGVHHGLAKRTAHRIRDGVRAEAIELGGDRFAVGKQVPPDSPGVLGVDLPVDGLLAELECRRAETVQAPLEQLEARGR